MVFGKKVTIFDWEWGRNSAPRDGQKRPWRKTLTCTRKQDGAIKNLSHTPSNAHVNMSRDM